jgi:uncharacterized protein YecE (DUF72 family)
VIRIGTSGWSYPGGRGSWNGVFYPARSGGRPTVDELAYYAEHFDTVEVNSTFYRVPSTSMTRSWAERTPRGFEFAIKLFQKFTHPAMYREAMGSASSPAPAAEPPPAIIPFAPAVPTATAEDAEAFAAAIEPLALAGKLGPLLAQFPPSFKNTSQTRDYLAWLLEQFRGIPMAIELRHKSWSDDPGREVRSLLGSRDAAWVQIDEPKFEFSIRQDLVPNTSAFFYMRLHGRNAAQWWDHEQPEDRYNYLYTPEELEPFAEAAEVARRLVKKLYLFMNNHFEAKGVANAAMLRHRLGLPVPGEYPDTFIEHFPQTKSIVSPERRRGLF